MSRQSKAGHELNKQSAVSLYRQLAERLLAQIDSGVLTEGQRLPSEPELMKQYGIGRITVRQAIELLREKNKVTVHRGKGTFVASKVVRHDLDELQGFYQALRSQGIEPVTSLIEWAPQIQDWTDEIPPELNLPVKLRRLYSVDDKPFALVTGYLPPEAGALTKAKVERLSVYEILEQFIGVKVKFADVTIRCENASRDIAKLLNLPKAGMTLLMERRSYDQTGSVCEYMRIHIVPERYEFRLRVKGQFELARGVHQVSSSKQDYEME
jgi:GntR family transcriptional regulator